MALMVMDWDFRLTAELAIPKNYQITRSYYGLGSFEVRTSEKAPGAAALVKDRVVFFSDAPHKAAILEKVTQKKGEITASGRLLKGIAARRLCVPPVTDDGHFGWSRFIGSAEAAYHHYAAANLYAPEDEKRKIPRLVAAENLDRGPVLPWQSRFGDLHALFADIGETTEVGWEVYADFQAKQFVFTACVGRDLTQGLGQSVVAEYNRNAGDISFAFDATAAKTTAYVGGSGEDENRLIVSVGNEATGLSRREAWVDAGSIAEMDMLRLAGRNRLDTAEEKETLTADLLDQGLCRYGRDFDIGDKIILDGGFASSQVRLLEVQEAYSDGKRTLRGTFGAAPVSFLADIMGLKNQTVR